MNTKHDLDWTPKLDTRHVLGRCVLALASFFVVASSQPSAAYASKCAIYGNAGSSYPALSESPAPDLLGESSVLLYMELDYAMIELDGCLYTVDRAVEVDFGDQDSITAKLELPGSSAGWTLFVTRDGVWTETIETASTSVAVMLWPDSTVELELAAPGQLRPIKPLVVLEPTPPNPTP